MPPNFSTLMRPQTQPQQPAQGQPMGRMMPAGQASFARPGAAQFGAQQPRPMGQMMGQPRPMPGGFGGIAGMARGQAMQAAPPAPMAQGPQAAPRMPQMGAAMGNMGPFAMSDEQSKQEIARLRERNAALSGAAVTPDEQKRSEDFRGVNNYSYEYKPEFRDQPGAGHGEFSGPMAHELRPLGVTNRGGDGMERVDMQRLPLETAGEVGNQRRELDDLRKRLRDLEGGAAVTDEEHRAAGF